MKMEVPFYTAVSTLECNEFIEHLIGFQVVEDGPRTVVELPLVLGVLPRTHGTRSSRGCDQSLSLWYPDLSPADEQYSLAMLPSPILC